MFFRKRGNIKSSSDEELVTAYKESGDSVLLGELFERYTHMVYLVCMKYLKDPMESEDMSMQIFEKLMTDLKKYEVRSFKHWLHTVTKNQCLIYLEKKNRRRHKVDEYKETQQALMESEDLWNLTDEKEVQLVQLEKAITELKEEQKVCVELFYLKKKSYQEVSDLTGYNMKQVKSYIQNGKRNLKKYLEDLQAAGPIHGTSE